MTPLVGKVSRRQNRQKSRTNGERKNPLASEIEPPISAGSPGQRRGVGRPLTNGRPTAESAALLKAAMRVKAVTVKEAAAAVGAHERTVTGWRAGDRGPSAEEAEKLAKLLDRPELPSWWDWPPGSGPATAPAAGAPQENPEADPGAVRERADQATTRPRRRARRWAVLAIVGVVVLSGLVIVLAYTTRPANRSAAVDKDATTSAAPTPGDRLNSGPTITIDGLSCSRLVHVPPAATTEETQGTLGATTFTDPVQICGVGPKIGAGLTVRVACRLLAPQMSSVNPGGYWYLVAAGPNRGRFAAANTFLNGDAPGAGDLTNTDVSVPRCKPQ